MAKKIGFAITGSFCTFEKIIPEIEKLKDNGCEILPIFSFSVRDTDTRFGKAKDFRNTIVNITNRQPIDSLVLAEPIGPKGMIDILVIAPATGNTISKLANAISDTPVTMVAKSMMRNNKPIVIGISTNDALGLNLENIAKLLTVENIFFVPFGQDDFEKKPKSMISDWTLLEKTIESALCGKQIQPLILQNKE